MDRLKALGEAFRKKKQAEEEEARLKEEGLTPEQAQREYGATSNKGPDERWKGPRLLLCGHWGFWGEKGEDGVLNCKGCSRKVYRYPRERERAFVKQAKVWLEEVKKAAGEGDRELMLENIDFLEDALHGALSVVKGTEPTEMEVEKFLREKREGAPWASAWKKEDPSPGEDETS